MQLLRCVPSHCNCIITFEKIIKSIVLLLHPNEEGIAEAYSGSVHFYCYTLPYKVSKNVKKEEMLRRKYCRAIKNYKTKFRLISTSRIMTKPLVPVWRHSSCHVIKSLIRRPLYLCCILMCDTVKCVCVGMPLVLDADFELLCCRQFFRLISPPTTRGEYLEDILCGFAAQYVKCNHDCGLPQGRKILTVK